MRLLSFLNGALTSKPYAFVSRPWELESIDGFDFYDSFGTPIRFDLRGREIVRILPRTDDRLNGEWLADRTRFSYDAFRRQRLTSPLSSIPPSDEEEYSSYDSCRLRPVTWREALAAIVPLSRVVYFSLGGFVDLGSSFAIRNYYLEFSRSWYFSLSRLSSSVEDSRSSYLSSGLVSLLRSDLILLLGFTPRLESPLLHLRLRSLAQKGSAQVVLLGSNSSLVNFPFSNLGASVSSFLSLLEGRSPLSVAIALARAPSLLLGGSSSLRSVVLSAEPIFRSFNPAFSLEVHYSRSYAIHQRECSLPRVSTLPATRQLPILWLAEDDESNFDGSFFSLVVYQGHHGDINASRSDIVLPVPAPWEKSSTFLSFQGDRCSLSSPVSTPPSESRTVYDTLRAISLASFSQDLPPPSGISSMQISSTFSVPSPLSSFSVPNSPILPSLFVPYLGDSISRSSHVLALAARRFESRSVFLKS